MKTQLAAFLHLEVAEFVELVALLAAFTVIVALLRGLLQGTQRFVAFSLSFVIENTGRALLASVGVMLGIRGDLLRRIVAGVAATAYTYLRLRTTLRAPPSRLRIDFRRLMTTGGGIAIASSNLAIIVNGVVHLTSIIVSYNMGRHRFGFVVALLFVVVSEIVAIGLFHKTPTEIDRVVP